MDVFYFYVMYAKIGEEFRLIGYFSKEKPLLMVNSNILSCILTVQCYQYQGYGNILIDMAYMLASRDNLIGSPEKPLSDLGYMAFSKYWRYRIFEYLTEHDLNNISVADIVMYTNFTAVDIQQTLRNENVLIPRKTGDFVFYCKENMMEEFLKNAQKMETKGAHRLQDKYLHYYPCVITQMEYQSELENIPCWVKNLG